MTDRIEEARRAIREWADRPPMLPPGAARTRVIAHLDDPRPSRPRGWLAALAAGAALAAALVLVDGPRPDRTSRPAPEAPATAPPAALVYELGSGATLYVLLQPVPPAPKGEST